MAVFDVKGNYREGFPLEAGLWCLAVRSIGVEERVSVAETGTVWSSWYEMISMSDKRGMMVWEV